MEIDSNELEQLLNQYEQELIKQTKHADWKLSLVVSRMEAVVEVRKRLRELVANKTRN